MSSSQQHPNRAPSSDDQARSNQHHRIEANESTNYDQDDNDDQHQQPPRGSSISTEMLDVGGGSSGDDRANVTLPQEGATRGVTAAAAPHQATKNEEAPAKGINNNDVPIKKKSSSSTSNNKNTDNNVSMSPDAVGFFTQYIATLRRQILQKSRMPCGWAIEILIPIIFVVGIILISLAVTIEEKPGLQFVTDDNSVTQVDYNIRTSMCYASATTTGSGLQALLQPCPFTRSTIPDTALCMSDDVLSLINITARDICVSDLAVAAALSRSTGFKQQVAILDFDDMVLLQLMFRVVFGGPPVSLFAADSVSASLRTSGALYFTPKSDLVERVLNTMQSKYKLFDLVYSGTYDSRDAITSTLVEGKTWGIIDIKQPQGEGSAAVTIALNRSALPQSDELRPRYETGGLETVSYSQYWGSGFLTLQTTLFEILLNNDTMINATTAAITPVIAKSTIALVPMGYADYKDNAFLVIAGSLAPLMLVLAFLYPVSQVAKRFVEEKELRLREGTMIMGLGKGAFFCSWLTIYHAQMILLSVLIAILLKVTVMTGSDWFLIFFTFALFGIATVHLAALLATCFSSSKVTALVVPLLYFGMAIPSFAIPPGSADGIYPILSFLCPVPFSVGLQLLFGYEINDGMGWGNLGSSTDTPMNMGGVLGYFILDIIIYTLLMIYFDLVIPKQWGTTYHPCFCFCCCCDDCCVDKDEEDEVEFGDNASQHYEGGTANSKIPRPWLSRTSHLVQRQLETNRKGTDETSPKSTRQATSDMTIDTVQDYPLPVDQATVHIKRMRKVFDAPSGVKKKNVAVNNFDLRLYPNTITALLGHNGAGKTTVMNMITGMLNITTGDVNVYGDSVTKDLQKVRRKVGYCPQHNILWDDLTCIEHLEYFGRLKGMSGAALTEEVEHLLREVDLWEKANNRSHELSGGQKRKLSVAIAFMGGANLILLDEPTAGMDVGARRHTWELLKEMSSKNNRTVLLTTHFMDEADLLGSRIAIMSKGEMEAYGTSTFLKNKLGTGYVMKIASSEPFKNPEQVLTEVQRTIPPAELKECKGLEMTLALPKTHIREFAGVIRKLESEEMRRAFKISTISMSVSTLEDVFVQMALDEELRGHEATAGINSDDDNEDTKAINVDESKNWLPVLERCYLKQLERAQRITDGGEPDQSASGAFMRQLGGLFMKRVNHAKRDYRTLFLQIVLPIIVIIIAMGLGEIPIPEAASIQLNGELYSADSNQAIQMNGCAQPIVDVLPGYQQVTTSDLQTLNYSIDLQNTAKSHGGVERMAGASCNKPGVTRTFNNSIIDATANFTSLFVNGSAYHIAPIILNQLYAASARYASGNTDLPVELTSYTLPRTKRQEAIIEGISGVVVTIFILIPFTFIPSTYVGYAVKEKETKSKHLQFVSGVHYLAYWLANFVFDFLCFLVTMAIALIIFAIFGRDEFVGGPAETFGATFVLLLFYGVSGITSAYAISFLFDNSSTAQNMVMFGNFIAGFMLVLVVYILGAVSESGKDVTDVIAWIFRLIPAYCLGEGLIQLSAAKSSFEINGVRKDPFGTEVVGYDLIYMGIMAIGYFILVLIIDNPSTPAIIRRLFPCIRGDDAFENNNNAATTGDGDGAHRETSQPRDNDDMSVRDAGGVELNEEERLLIEEGEDEDVSRERQEIRSGARADDAVRVNRLRKVYPNGKVAVRSLTFGVKKGEVFGFLGTNGAGKTTTMSMLTGEFAPSSGGGMIGPYNVVENARDAQRIIGYCPQFDAVMELMTPFEHLTLYASLRLVPVGEETDSLIEALMAACDLLKYRDIPSGNLSGGNRRKLSIAIALIGGPQVVFLDEPSAGIDPAARRQLFDAITFIATHSAVVLTTHHLEEVDVLAHRVGIMDRGAMKCLGSLESLKAKYGDGIEVTLQATTEVGEGETSSSVEENVLKAKKFMESAFPDATISEERQQRLLYVLPFSSIKLSDLFEKIMEAVDSGAHGIQDYTVQQSSLEQVFLRISRQGEEEEEEDAGGGETKSERGLRSSSIAAPPSSSTRRRKNSREEEQ